MGHRRWKFHAARCRLPGSPTPPERESYERARLCGGRSVSKRHGVRLVADKQD